ncbi:type I restriction enzyme HsdR N-terminal domain-containing protein [Peribacillus loiseleuriae]|uniref:type I restriction enzyme HsdR N-terminal domain-containing protein n=1 Tax=Peribacillus loiseleuriae TaxID=1679170 RepID=UPI003D01BFCF
MRIDLSKYEEPTIFTRDGKEVYLDPCRQRFTPKTREEEVRQKFILFLIREMNVPINMIDTEVPMSYFSKGVSGRADIVIYYRDDETGLDYPVLIVECKAWDIPLTDEVFDQIYRYEDTLNSNTILITNGEDLFIESWNEKDGKYYDIRLLPKYKELISNDFEYNNAPIGPHKRKSIEEFNNKDYLDYMSGNLGEDTDTKFYPLLLNLNEMLWDDNQRYTSMYLKDLKIKSDIGLRYTSFGNAAGFNWTGDYRSFIIEDLKGNNQIISFGILYGYLNVAIDDNKKSHNSLQYKITRFVQKDGDKYTFQHNGRLTLGKSGSCKVAEVINFVRERAPELVDDLNEISLGTVKCDKDFTWDMIEIQNLFGNLIKYALIRDEFRVYKSQSLVKVK